VDGLRVVKNGHEVLMREAQARAEEALLAQQQQPVREHERDVDSPAD
jgi:hypothetical protein